LTRVRDPELPRTVFESLDERDIDLLVLEELHASPDFLSWWLERVGVVGEPLATKFIGAWHSVSHPTLGESDLLLLVGDGNGKRYAVLTENKIDAPPQAQQGERYRQRGTAGVEDGLWHDFRTCIIAPKRYLTSSNDVMHYDAQIPYEDIKSWFLSHFHDSKRGTYKVRLLEAAIDQQRRVFPAKNRYILVHDSGGQTDELVLGPAGELGKLQAW